MPDAAVRAARKITDVPTPDYLIPLRTRLLDEHLTELFAVHAVLDERFGRTAADCLPVFKAAAELALMEQVGRDDLAVIDRWRLRRFWEALLSAW